MRGVHALTGGALSRWWAEGSVSWGDKSLFVRGAHSPKKYGQRHHGRPMERAARADPGWSGAFSNKRDGPECVICIRDTK